jgi:hypothetical protein
MSAFLNQRLTNAGWDALSIALGGGRLTFWKMQAGSGTIANDSAIMGMTALVAPVCDIPITSYVIEGDGQITLFGNINSSELDAGFTFKELGVFATIEPPTGRGGTPSGPNIQAITQAPSTQANPVVPPPAEGTALMYSYANAYDLGDYIPGSGESTDVTNTVQVTIKIDEAQDVIINILQGEQFAVVNIGPPSVGAGPWSYTQANVAYMKRLVPGAAMLITEDTDTITIGAKQLTADLDLYVANGNPDISPDFSTIQNALNYLGQFLIPTTIRARIWVQPGTYVLATNGHVNITHPNAQNITIQGPQNATLRATSVSSITGSTKNWSVTFAGIPSTASVAVNNWVIVNNPAGPVATTMPLVCGFFKVTAKTATTITVLIPWRGGSFAMPGAVTGIDITPITAIVSAPLNTYSLVSGAQGVGMVQYLGFLAQVTPTLGCSGVTTAGRANYNYIGVANYNPVLDLATNLFSFGIVASSAVGNAVCTNCAVTNCTMGFVGSTGGNVSMYSCASTHNLSWGCWFDAGGSCFFAYGPSYIAGNGDRGIIVGGGTTVIVIGTYPNRGQAWTYYNGGAGLFVQGRSMFAMMENTALRCWGNTTYDLAVTTMSLFSGQALVYDSKAVNIPIGILSSDGSLIV